MLRGARLAAAQSARLARRAAPRPRALCAPPPPPPGDAGENALEAAVLVALSAPSPGAASAFYETLLRSWVVALGRELGARADGGASGEAGGFEAAVTWTIREERGGPGGARGGARGGALGGVRLVPAFTSPARLAAAGAKFDGAPTASMPAHELMLLTRGSALVLNPDCPEGLTKTLQPDEIEFLLEVARSEDARAERRRETAAASAGVAR